MPTSICGAAVFLSIISCGKKEIPQPKTVVPPPQISQPAPEVVVPQEKPIYVYSGDRFKDPFMPAGQSTNYQPDATFDPQRATVKGIIFGKQFRSAVLNVGGSGTYFIRADNLFDIMGKKVEGYRAKVFVNKVTIVGDADNVYELKIKNSDEEGKPL